MTRDADIIRSRAAVRREVALAAWHAIKSELEALGLELTLFGSLAKGGFSTHSDIDVIVQLGDSGISRSAVDRMVRSVSGDIPVDLFFVEDLTQSDLMSLLST
ncbi:nucleotidyltransferase domain-containing protein [Sulfitobacter pontiacus]|jgi:predicted nucleotidyltransferase|uniref:nucleotidyltransferase domain-containing protein n=1 Tax=Sulfitobacter pontiacus TaxID=60137 RepID=UPI00161E4C8D|nr:nucleotidyltransferase domain-containing protein [Sulfitobacter pontiacus]UWR20570.1 nucleotidyltransferase domain-containing protein [Sulfitobacter pontiacus]|tara:strand:+ start:344 stop:652 length:309 start_codon:yes stop_codon:yes gene_type:complete